jgi:hypothetical protein
MDHDPQQQEEKLHQRMAMMTKTTPNKNKSDVDPLYERRRWRRRSTADFRHATPTSASAANVATRASRSEWQLPIVASDSEDSSETPLKPRRDSNSPRVSINGNSNANAKGSVRARPSIGFRRAASRSFRGIWQGGDGAYDAASSCMLAAPHLLQQQVSPRKNDCLSAAATAAGVVSRFAMRRHAVMEGIKERIAGLRSRAETAPGRLEWGAA